MVEDMSEDTNVFVLGFAFSQDLERIVTIRKNRPKPLAGKLSVPGGRVKTTDPDPLFAVVREFKEETEVKSKSEDWTFMETFPGINGWPVHIFIARDNKFMSARTPPDSPEEPIFVRNVQDLLQDPSLHEHTGIYIKKSLEKLKP